MKTQTEKGFGLVEVLFAVGLAALLIAVTAVVMKQRLIQADQSGSLAVQAQEMALIARAAQLHAQTASADKADGAVWHTTPAELQSAGLLDRRVAMRTRGGVQQVGTPLGQTYSITSKKVSALDVRTIVYETGSLDESAVARLAPAGDADSILGMKQQVARNVNVGERAFAAVIAKGTTLAQGTGASFQVDLTDYMSPADTPAAVVLLNFPELNVGEGGGDLEDGFNFGGRAYGQCKYMESTAERNFSCPAGHVKVAEWPMCAGIQGDVVHPTGVGSVIMSKYSEVQPLKLVCEEVYADTAGESGTWCGLKKWTDGSGRERLDFWPAGFTWVQDEVWDGVASLQGTRFVTHSCGSLLFGAQPEDSAACLLDANAGSIKLGLNEPRHQRYEGEVCERLVTHAAAGKPAGLCCSPL